jgi:methyl-accepting chemotaxis protein/methyl-accepting chemotaxis protein-1 (serine sensor receptor)
MSSFTVGKKLFLSVGALITFTFALGVVAILSITSVGDRLHNIVEKTVERQTLAHEIALDSAELRGGTRGILMRGYQKDASGIQRDGQQYASFANSLQGDIDKLDPMLVASDAKQALQEIRETSGIMQQANQEIVQACLAGDMTRGIALYTDTFKPAQLRLSGAASRILKAQTVNLAMDEDAAKASATSSRWMTALVLLLTCCVGMATIFVVRGINAMLRGSVAELAESAVQIASAAGQVSTSSQSLAQGSSEQAATIEETSSASVEISAMAQRNTENSRTTVDLITQSQTRFEQTNKSLTEMVDAMEGITGSSKKISKIIKVIDEIAFQTNILALNAAVEAARAGEAGMGFAVVADEVRNLAQRCAQAAKDTADLIEESIQKSAGGQTKVDRVAVEFHAITVESAKIRTLVDEINVGSIEQSRGIDEISRSITQMEQVTQRNAAGAEEGAAAAEQLNAQAEAMKDVVHILRNMVDGEGRRDAALSFGSNAIIRPSLFSQSRAT